MTPLSKALAAMLASSVAPRASHSSAAPSVIRTVTQLASGLLALNAWQKLVVIYDAELEYIDDKPRRIELLREIARIHETRGGNQRLGFQALARALAELVKESGSVDEEAEIYDDLERLARAESNWGDLVAAVHTAIEGSYDAELLARMHARVARVRDAELRDVTGAIESWRKAWTTRDVQGYVGSYTADYAPRGMTHGAWTAQRRDRLASASFVRVSIDELDVEFPDANTATARFVQGYSSDNYEDRVRKTLTLSRTASGWRIAREDSQPL